MIFFFNFLCLRCVPPESTLVLITFTPLSVFPFTFFAPLFLILPLLFCFCLFSCFTLLSCMPFFFALLSFTILFSYFPSLDFSNIFFFFPFSLFSFHLIFFPIFLCLPFPLLTLVLRSFTFYFFISSLPSFL